MNILHVWILFDFIVVFHRLVLRIAGLIEHNFNLFFLLMPCVPYVYTLTIKLNTEKREQIKSCSTEVNEFSQLASVGPAFHAGYSTTARAQRVNYELVLCHV